MQTWEVAKTQQHQAVPSRLETVAWFAAAVVSTAVFVGLPLLVAGAASATRLRNASTKSRVWLVLLGLALVLLQIGVSAGFTSTSVGPITPG